MSSRGGWGLCSAVLMLALAGGCRYHATLSAEVEGAPAEIVGACRLAEARCSRCHVIDRVTHAQIDSPQQWQYYVHRMRLQPASAISESEEPTLVRCLVYMTFGAPGLDQLGTAAGTRNPPRSSAPAAASPVDPTPGETP